MKDHLSESEPIAPENLTGPQAPDTEEVPVDTAKIQAALEKRADQETTVLPHLTLPDTQESGKPAQSASTPLAALRSAQQKKRRTSRSFCERWWTPSVRSWFFTFMCMNMPIVGWFYLFHEARHEEDPGEFFSCRVFFIPGFMKKIEPAYDWHVHAHEGVKPGADRWRPPALT